ncbi:PD-(D/E)XK nuclease family protein [Sphingobium limneticum]|uniref:PD-(D/E)XK nuclease family protein n=1 Tax=Sphingobium limneticum TaxID=1007511 RepID=UPI003D012B6D
MILPDQTGDMSRPMEHLTSKALESAFLALRVVLPATTPRAPKQFYALHDLQAAFQALKAPLAAAKDRGGLINPWALASLNRDEVRNAAALAGLWMSEFGGAPSRRFASSYLTTAIPEIDWSIELGGGYRVEKEVCPLGEGADRVDLVIVTSRHLIGVEVKIRAGLGRDQLERYSLAIGRRADLQRLKPWVVLLAPIRTSLPTVASTSWRDVARAARAAAGEKGADRSFVQHLIASFGDHVQDF